MKYKNTLLVHNYVFNFAGPYFVFFGIEKSQN